MTSRNQRDTTPIETLPNPKGPTLTDQVLWQQRLGRIRLGVEPIDRQLARYRQATWVLTGITLGIGLILLSLFTGFGRIDLGLWIAGSLVIPILTLAWMGHSRLCRVVDAYHQAHPTHEG